MSLLHRRNPSHSDDEGASAPALISPRLRVNSSPDSPGLSPSSRSPTFSMPAGHSRTRSISSTYSPTLPSPLSGSFPNVQLTASVSNPEASAPGNHARRHSRIHSRNLSIYFPRPGTLPTSTISEDGTQELELKPEQPAITMNRSPHTPFGAGFTFGGRPPSNGLLASPPAMSQSSSSSTSSRRGHHHKHSLSHNFFSFLEPGGDLGASPTLELHTQPTPTPKSPWSRTDFQSTPNSAPAASSQNGHIPSAQQLDSGLPLIPVLLSCAEFVLGAWLWVSGQQRGSLSCTGLGYWVVFDSIGIAVSYFLPWYLRQTRNPTIRDLDAIQRPYGNSRIQTVFAFSQAVYLLFSSVYVCKETVEHVLLSAGGSGDGHHHHHGDHGDEDSGMGIQFPIVLIFLSLFSIIISGFSLNNHADLVQMIGNRLSYLTQFDVSSRESHSPVVNVLTNPYILSPVTICLSILALSLSVPPSQHRTCDLVVACFITVITFNVAFQASTTLGTVLLQTAPRRGLPGGKMEAFLRAMRELERHPQVLHLPPPHIWQLTPSTKEVKKGAAPLVVTLELHVREDLSDDDVLILTSWAWEKCVAALGGTTKIHDAGSKVEVTVGVVRG